MFYQNTDGSFKILGIFYVERTKREISELGREYTSFAYRIEGSSTFSVDGEKLFAGTGSVSYIPAGCDFKRKTEGLERLIVFHLQPLGKNDPKLQIKQKASELEPLFLKSLKLWEEKGASSHNRCMALLYHIFDSLEQMGENGDETLPESIAPGVRLLQKDFRDPHLTAAAMAEICGVSESYFRRVYRAHFGASPWQTILDFRFRYACNLLLSGYYTPRQVSELCGFTDVKYFRVAFKKRYGVTPSEYAVKKHSSESDD